MQHRLEIEACEDGNFDVFSGGSLIMKHIPASRFRKITCGEGAGQVGLFGTGGTTLIGIVNDPSPIVLLTDRDKARTLREVAEQHARFLNPLPELLAARVAELIAGGSGEIEALIEATADPEMSALWQKYRERHGATSVRLVEDRRQQ